MKSLVLNGLSDPNRTIRLCNSVILRTGDSTVYSTQKEYSFKVNATKRRRIGEGRICTLPYGYCNNE